MSKWIVIVVLVVTSIGVGLTIGTSIIPRPQAKAPPPTHAYATWDRFELERCVAAWIVKRYIDAEATFHLYPVGTVFPIEGYLTFDAPGANHERTPGRTVSVQLMEMADVRDDCMRRLVEMARTAELAYWRLDASSEAGRLRDQLLTEWERHADVGPRLAAIFEILDQTCEGADGRGR